MARGSRWDEAISELEARLVQEMNALRPSHETSYSRLAELTTALMNLHIIRHNTRED